MLVASAAPTAHQSSEYWASVGRWNCSAFTSPVNLQRSAKLAFPFTANWVALRVVVLAGVRELRLVLR
jgi:hypothetical protein